MPIIKSIITTYVCPKCRFQFIGDAEDEEVWDASYASIPIAKGLPRLHCLACYTGKNHGLGRGLVRFEKYTGTDLSLAGTQTIASDDELESITRDELDANGKTVLIQTGERKVPGIVDGELAVVTELLFEPKQRDLTNKELEDLTTKRNESLDKHEAIAVKEVSAEAAPDQSPAPTTDKPLDPIPSTDEVTP